MSGITEESLMVYWWFVLSLKSTLTLSGLWSATFTWRDQFSDLNLMSMIRDWITSSAQCDQSNISSFRIRTSTLLNSGPSLTPLLWQWGFDWGVFGVGGQLGPRPTEQVPLAQICSLLLPPSPSRPHCLLVLSSVCWPLVSRFFFNAHFSFLWTRPLTAPVIN